jgi:hypothetical protein
MVGKCVGAPVDARQFASTHENARRLINRRAIGPSLLDETPLEHAEHDGSDEGECDIGGNNAQSAD